MKTSQLAIKLLFFFAITVSITIYITIYIIICINIMRRKYPSGLARGMM